MRYPSLIGACLLVLTACAQPPQVQTTSSPSTPPAPPPMVDGRCDEYAALEAAPIAVADDVELFLHQDPYFVWLCFTYPEGSFGMTEMFLDTEALAEPLTLHVSAQLGEWPTDKPDLAPQTANSDLWWNHQGWVSNAVWFNGFDRSGEQPQANFKPAAAREIQLSKSRFGRGDWRFRLEIRGLRRPDGGSSSADFPADGEFYVLSTD